MNPNIFQTVVPVSYKHATMGKKKGLSTQTDGGRVI